ncbi:hypothetical protein NHX12_018953 [Muraenolepis orangiensis]|uniref:Uncharacterized protein n=1 Tax=Muraenolepis orangiensis TaxID=630683 RepID=A0A9Q0EVU7_9TELE|nr:hypothetical protein NHX12_018953 [Muraenolepis orangiensis]
MEVAPLQLDAQVKISGAETVQADAPVVTEFQASSTYPSGPGASIVQEGGAQSEATVSEANEIPETPLDSSLAGDRALVILSRIPVARLTMWLPGRPRTTHPLPETGVSSTLPSGVKAASEPRDSLPNDIQSDSPAKGEDLPVSPGSKKSIRREVSSDAAVVRMPLMVDGWPITASLEKTALLEESKRKRWGPIPQMRCNKAQEVYKGLATENEWKQREERLNHLKDPVEATTVSDAGPVIRSRVQFSKGVDGSQTLSYEEDVMKQQQAEPKMRSLGKEEMVAGNQKGQRVLSTFLELLRHMRAE